MGITEEGILENMIMESWETHQIMLRALGNAVFSSTEYLLLFQKRGEEFDNYRVGIKMTWQIEFGALFEFEAYLIQLT